MGTESHKQTPSVQELCRRIKDELERGPKHDVELIRKLLEEYVRDGKHDWKEYTFFNDQRYARNLIELNEYFELMVICWKAGQVSPIHNHAGSSCWMSVAEGELMEEYFHVRPKPGAEGCCQLDKGEVHLLSQGSVGYISDEIAVHRIRPSGPSNLVSIHLYAPPIKSCQVFCPQLERITDAKMCYHTVNRCKVQGGLDVYHVKLS